MVQWLAHLHDVVQVHAVVQRPARVCDLVQSLVQIQAVALAVAQVQ